MRALSFLTLTLTDDHGWNSRHHRIRLWWPMLCREERPSTRASYLHPSIWKQARGAPRRCPRGLGPSTPWTAGRCGARPKALADSQARASGAELDERSWQAGLPSMGPECSRARHRPQLRARRRHWLASHGKSIIHSDRAVFSDQRLTNPWAIYPHISPKFSASLIPAEVHP